MIPALVILLLMSATGRMHGIGDIPGGRILSTAILGLCFAIGGIAIYGPLGALGGIISAFGFTLGHGNFYAMQGVIQGHDEPEGIEKETRGLWFLLFPNRNSLYTPAYSWWCMGLKWFLISAIIFPYALLVAWVGPACYAVSFSYTKSSALAEWLTTIFSGLIIAYLCLNNSNELARAYQLGASYVENIFGK